MMTLQQRLQHRPAYNNNETVKTLLVDVVISIYQQGFCFNRKSFFQANPNTNPKQMLANKIIFLYNIVYILK